MNTPDNRGSPWVELAMIIGAFVVATLLAELFGAINLGTALAFGQIALAATVGLHHAAPALTRGRRGSVASRVTLSGARGTTRRPWTR